MAESHALPHEVSAYIYIYIYIDIDIDETQQIFII